MTSAGAETQTFEAIMAGIEIPSYVVTTAAAAEQAGCLVAFATRCSMDPPRFSVWLSKLNRTYRVAQSGKTLVVHLLRDGDRDLAVKFGGDTGDEIVKFADIEWFAGPDGCPVIERLDWFAGSIVDRVDTGDHVAFVVVPRVGRCRRRGVRQLPYSEIGGIEAGHPIPGH